jgi:hypothetical protein
MEAPQERPTPEPTVGWRALWPTALRFLLYAALPALLIETFVIASGWHRAYHVAKENAPLEWVQALLLAATIVLMLAAARRRRSVGKLLRWLVVFPLWALMRELDDALDEMLFEDAWKIIATLAVVPFLYAGWRNRRALVRQAVRFARTRAFVLFFCAFVAAVVVAQLVGQADLWQNVMGPRYMRDVKRVVEELTETFAYCMALSAGVECLVENGADGSIPAQG